MINGSEWGKVYEEIRLLSMVEDYHWLTQPGFLALNFDRLKPIYRLVLFETRNMKKASCIAVYF